MKKPTKGSELPTQGKTLASLIAEATHEAQQKHEIKRSRMRDFQKNRHARARAALEALDKLGIKV